MRKTPKRPVKTPLERLPHTTKIVGQHGTKISALYNSIEKATASIEHARTRLHEFIENHISRAITIERELLAVRERLTLFKPSEVEKLHRRSLEDARTVHRAYKRLINKITVSSEVLYYCRKSRKADAGLIAQTVVRAFDEPDLWWDKREHRTLDTWVRTLERQAKKYALDDAPTGPRRSHVQKD